MSVANENGFTKEAASQSVSQGVDIGSESKPAIIIIGDHDKTIVNYLLATSQNSEGNEVFFDNRYYTASAKLYIFPNIKSAKFPNFAKNDVQAIIYRNPETLEEILERRSTWQIDLEMVVINTLETNEFSLNESLTELKNFCLQNGIIANELYPNKESLEYYEECCENFGLKKIYEDLMTVRWANLNLKSTSLSNGLEEDSLGSVKFEENFELICRLLNGERN